MSNIPRREFLRLSGAIGASLATGSLARDAAAENVNSILLYVSPHGRAGNPGTITQPLGNLEQARDVVRRLKLKTPGTPITVWIRGGNYTLSEPVIFGVADGGSAGAPITYSGYQNERPVFSGGLRITGWRRLKRTPEGLRPYLSNQVWEADLPEGLGLFHTLFSGEQRLPRASSRNFWDNPAEDIGWPVPGHPNTMAKIPAGVLRNWPNVSDLELAARSINWTVNLLPLAAVDVAANTVTTAVPSTYPLGFKKIEKGTRRQVHLRLENAIDFLDQQGQWVVDTLARKVYLWPLGDRPLDIIAPKLNQLILVQGKLKGGGEVHNPAEHLAFLQGSLKDSGQADDPVSHLVFRGLTFQHADRGVIGPYDAGIQHDWEMIDKDNGLVRFRGAEDCVVEDCLFTNSGGNAIRLDLYAQRIRLTKNQIQHMGQGAIMLIGYGPGTRNVHRDKVIDNNDIHNCGELRPDGIGIVLFQSGGNHVAYNFIHDMPRLAVSMTGVRLDYFRQGHVANPEREFGRSIRWSEIDPADVSSQMFSAISVHTPTSNKKFVYFEPVKLEKYLNTRNNLVEYNEVACCLGKLSDGAAINTTGAGLGTLPGAITSTTSTARPARNRRPACGPTMTSGAPYMRKM